MKVTIKTNIKEVNRIIKDHGLDDNGKVTEFLRNDCDRYMDDYIPKDTGTLKNTKTYPNNYSIKYTSNYAHYMYKGKKAIGASKPKGVKRTISNISLNYKGAPKRGAEWDKRMFDHRKNDIIKDVTNFIKEGI